MVNKKILVVDDEEDIVTLVKMRLEAEGYEVLTAFDGQQALDMVKKEVLDLIILDLMLPKISGYKVCRMLKFDEKYKKIPIIIFTARSHSSDKDLGMEVGADAYLMKPFESQALLSKIKELLAAEN